MKTDKKYYCVGVRFHATQRAYTYLCEDLTVSLGDRVIVPVGNTGRAYGTVVSAGFYSDEDIPYPLDGMRTVIEAVPREEKEKHREPVAVLETEESAVAEQETVGEEEEPVLPERGEKRRSLSLFLSDALVCVLSVLFVTPIGAVVILLPISVIMFVFGWKADDGFTVPFVISLIVSFGLNVYLLKHPEATAGKSTGAHICHGGSHGSGGTSGGWFPGCLEEKMFTSCDDAFDFDGDGHLNSIESDLKYDIFFGDDE